MAGTIGALGISSPSAAESLRAEAQRYLDAAAQLAKYFYFMSSQDRFGGVPVARRYCTVGALCVSLVRTRDQLCVGAGWAGRRTRARSR